MKRKNLFHLSGTTAIILPFLTSSWSVVADVLYKESLEKKICRVGTFAGAGLIFPLVTFDEFARRCQSSVLSFPKRRGSCPVCSTNTS